METMMAAMRGKESLVAVKRITMAEMQIAMAAIVPVLTQIKTSVFVEWRRIKKAVSAVAVAVADLQIEKTEIVGRGHHQTMMIAVETGHQTMLVGIVAVRQREIVVTGAETACRTERTGSVRRVAAMTQN